MDRQHTPFNRFLEQRLSDPLPGSNAHQKMMPVPVDPEVEIPEASIDSSGHPSGVLVPIYPDRENNYHVILTLRTNTIRHAGQISFPGGRSDKNESLVDTALRETREEIGIDSSDINVLGTLTPFYLYRSHNQITPVIGMIEGKPQMQRNPHEVEEIITVKLDTLLAEDYIKQERWDLAHNSFRVPYWNFHRVPLWGATAMIMSELLEIYKEFLKK
jgi:8-oxo-dGTP pyrophosphatase MutT (NUDIX family)